MALRFKSERELHASLYPELDILGVKPRRKRVHAPRVSNAETMLEQLRYAGHVGWQKDYRFHPKRKWLLDCAHPALRIAIEIEGLSGNDSLGVGRHRSRAGFIEDLTKYGEAFALGWDVLRGTSQDMRSGRLLQRLVARLRIRA